MFIYVQNLVCVIGPDNVCQHSGKAVTPHVTGQLLQLQIMTHQTISFSIHHYWKNKYYNVVFIHHKK